MQCDELWSFVHNKGNPQGVWLALDADTHEIVGVDIGKRDETDTWKLWHSLPLVYRQCAVAYTAAESLMQLCFPKSGIKLWIKRLD